MPANSKKHEAMRLISKMIQEDPDTPDFIRIDFAIIDKMDDIRRKLSDATEAILKPTDVSLNLKKEYLEYLQLAEAGLQSFLDSHGLDLQTEQGGSHV